MRIKNAKTKYSVAEIVTGAGEPDWKRLSKWITNVSDDGSDNTEEQGDYDGDGNEKRLCQVTQKLTHLKGHTIVKMMHKT